MLSDMNNAVTPAKAGVYPLNGVDSRFRRNDIVVHASCFRDNDRLAKQAQIAVCWR